jgi:hypothetical protein
MIFKFSPTLFGSPREPIQSHARAIDMIDLKLCRCVPLGEMTVQSKFRSNLVLGLATRGPKLKTQSDLTRLPIFIIDI